MSNNAIAKFIKKYQKSSKNSKLRKDYFRAFEKKMLYRTTKTENSQTTMGMVDKVLNKILAKA